MITLVVMINYRKISHEIWTNYNLIFKSYIFSISNFYFQKKTPLPYYETHFKGRSLGFAVWHLLFKPGFPHNWGLILRKKTLVPKRLIYLVPM